MSLTTCPPPEILNLIIDFLREPDGEGWNDFQGDLLNLQLVSREFCYIVRPLLFESIYLPGSRPEDWRSLTGSARELLRFIDRDPSLATCISDLEYHDPNPELFGPSEHKYSPEQLQHDHRIWSQFAGEMAHKSSIRNNFPYSSTPSELRQMSAAYDKTCIPILLLRLPNLRSLTYNGCPGGKNSFLLTPAAKDLWTCMPLKSLQVLKWGPDYRHYKRYSRYDESDPDEYDQPTNVWDAVSLLHFTPMLQHFQITDYYASNFGENPFPKNKLVLQFLTVLECASVLCDEKFGQWMVIFPILSSYI